MTTQKKNSRLSARAILCQVLGMLMALTVALPSAAGDAKSVFAETVNSIVFVNADLPGTSGEANIGSGVVVGKNVVVTNCHVIEGHTAIQVRQAADTEAREGYFLNAEYVYGNEEWDVCLLFVKELSSPPAAPVVKLGTTTSLEVGEQVYAIGAPHELELSLTGGIVSQLREQLFEGAYGGIVAPEIQADALTAPGSSGGGLFNADGELIGITTSGPEGVESITFSRPVELVAGLLALGSLEVGERRVAAALADALRHHAQAGHMLAQFDLGWLYESIDESDEVSSYQLTDGERWLANSSEGMFRRVADMKAAEWYKRAAEQGHTNAQYNLAVSYDNGVGASDGDKTQAAEWYSIVADKDASSEQDLYYSALSARTLGVLLEGGEGGIKQDAEAAAERFEQAMEEFLWLAKRKDSAAQYHLGETYKEGIGVEQDDRQAYVWFFVAAQNGDEDAAKIVDEMRAEYDADGIREAEADAEAWLKEFNPEEE